jgi:DNA relaxase NicK
VLIPVGAALVARDNVVETVRPYTRGRVSIEREVNRVQKRLTTNLRKFERRGETARNRLQRQVKKTRTQVEREARQRRNSVQKSVKSAGQDFGRGFDRIQSGVEELSPLS